MVVKIFSTKMGITSSGLYFENTLLNSQERYIESSSSSSLTVENQGKSFIFCRLQTPYSSARLHFEALVTSGSKFKALILPLGQFFLEVLHFRMCSYIKTKVSSHHVKEIKIMHTNLDQFLLPSQANPSIFSTYNLSFNNANLSSKQHNG